MSSDILQTGQGLGWMKFLGHQDESVDVRLSVDEFMLLKRALEEMCTAMAFSDRDFEVILGVQRHEAEGLLRRLDSVLARLRLVPDV